MDYIKDQTVNTYNAEIIPDLETPEQRQAMAEKVVNSLFNATSGVEFYGLTCFDKHGDGDKYGPSVYWTYTFMVPAIVGLNTITIDNRGGMDFNFHRLFTDTFEIYQSVKK